MFGIANGALLLLGLWSGTALERRSSSSSSSRSVAALLLKYAPGSYARDIRLLAEHVSWDELSVTPSGSIDVRGLRVVAGDDALLSAKRVTCGLSWLQWLHVAANVTVEEPVVSVVAYDPLLRDTNWRRLGHELNRELSSSSSSSNASSWCGVTGVAFVGGATATVEPCEALGGKDARVTLRVDSLGTDPTSRRIAAAVRRKGSLTPAEVCAIVREDAAESLRAKLKAALPAKKDWWRSLRPSAAGVLSVGGVPVDSLDDAKTAVGRVAKGTLKFAVAAALRVVPFLNGAEDSIADLLQEYGADTLARARHRLSSSGRNDNNATPPPEPSSSSSSSSSEGEIRVATVDTYQGSDANCVVLSFVKARLPLGDLLQDHGRLLVALTRAKRKLVALGSMAFLAHHSPVFTRLVAFARNANALHTYSSSDTSSDVASS